MITHHMFQTWCDRPSRTGPYSRLHACMRLCMCKQGKMMYAKRPGDVYTGSFRDGQRHGQGLYEHANGERYQGSFVNGAREGQVPISRASCVCGCCVCN